MVWRMMDSFLGITWTDRAQLYWLPIVVCVLFILIYYVIKEKRVQKCLAGPWANRLFIHNSSIKKYIKILFIMSAFIALVLALARPQWGEEKEEKIKQKSRDLFIALDISRSMLAQDCLPTRLECAKEKIRSLLSYLQAERIGLVLFSGAAVIQCPLTTDYAAFNLYLDQVDVESISSGSTALDQMIKEVVDAYKRTQERKNKLLVILTDGEDFSHNLLSIKEQAQEQGMHIFALGIGTDHGGPIPTYDALGNRLGHQRDEKGNIVITRLNEDVLNSLATDVGGQYVRMTDTHEDVQLIAHLVQSFEKEEIEEKNVVYGHDLYAYFLLTGFIFLLIDWVL